MENDDDFTFCKVGVLVESDGIDAQKVARDIGGIVIKDESANDSSKQNTGILWKDKLSSHAASQKQAAAGSLSFNVIDASTREQVSGYSKQAAGEDTGNSGQGSREQTTRARKSAPRAKVPFEKGYSPMDWLKLTAKHPDLAGLEGQSNRRLISMNEVKKHQTEDSMWTVLKGRVYNIAPYMKFHPGGADKLMKAVGKDCIALFNKYHAWVNADFLLEKCLVGILDDSQ